MSGKPSEQEPSIEEILASIRQIISDDDETAKPAEVELPKEEKFEIPVAAPEPPKEEPRPTFADVLDLTNEIPPEEPVRPKEEPRFEIPVAAPEPPKKTYEVDFRDQNDDFDFSPARRDEENESLFSRPAANATADAFSRLVGNMPIDREPRRSSSSGGVTLEDITRDLLRPMLREWIDENVPRLVERLVEKELEKLARKARD